MKAKRLHFGKLKFLQLPNNIKENSKQKNKQTKNGQMELKERYQRSHGKKKKEETEKGILEARE